MQKNMCLKFISQLIIYLIDKFNISIACCGNINITMMKTHLWSGQYVSFLH